MCYGTQARKIISEYVISNKFAIEGFVIGDNYVNSIHADNTVDYVIFSFENMLVYLQINFLMFVITDLFLI